MVLRSIRYGEADRIVHLYTPGRGRVGAIAKGVRRTRSRVGGRLEPFCRVALVLYEGRGDLLTVTGTETIESHARLRSSAPAIDAAARACDAVGRIFETSEPHPGVYNLICNELLLLDREPDQATYANALAFRMKLLIAAGLTPQLGACASCGGVEHLVGFGAAAGGVVCSACEATSFAITAEAHDFMTSTVSQPLAQERPASERALRQVDRAISETLEHHAQLRLRPAVGTTR